MDPDTAKSISPHFSQASVEIIPQDEQHYDIKANLNGNKMRLD